MRAPVTGSQRDAPGSRPRAAAGPAPHRAVKTSFSAGAVSKLMVQARISARPAAATRATTASGSAPNRAELVEQHLAPFLLAPSFHELIGDGHDLPRHPAVKTSSSVGAVSTRLLHSRSSARPAAATRATTVSGSAPNRSRSMVEQHLALALLRALAVDLVP